MSVRLNGSTSGYTELDAPAVAGNNTLKMPANNGAAYQIVRNGATPGSLELADKIVSGTAQNSTSGSSIDFTGIPSWAKRVTVMFSGVSTNGTSPIQIQLGKSGGVETTNYNCVCTVAATGVVTAAFSSGFGVQPAGYAFAARSYHGHLVLSLMDGSANTWTANGAFVDTAGLYNFFTNGAKSLSGTLDRIRITTVSYVTNPATADTFDAGSINILYE